MSESIDICIDQIKKRKDLNNEQIHKGVSSKILQKQQVDQEAEHEQVRLVIVQVKTKLQQLEKKEKHLRKKQVNSLQDNESNLFCQGLTCSPVLDNMLFFNFREEKLKQWHNKEAMHWFDIFKDLMKKI